MRIISWKINGLKSKKKSNQGLSSPRISKQMKFQETNRQEYDRRFVSSEWTARSKGVDHSTDVLDVRKGINNMGSKQI